MKAQLHRPLRTPFMVGLSALILGGCMSAPLNQQSAKDVAIKAMGSQALKTSYEIESISRFSLVRLKTDQSGSADLQDRIEVEDYRGPDQALITSSGSEQTALVASLSADTAFDTLLKPTDLTPLSEDRALEIKKRVYEQVYAAVLQERSSSEVVDLAAFTAQDVVIAEIMPKAVGYFELSPEQQDELHASLGSELDDVLELSYQVDENIYSQLNKVLKPDENPLMSASGPSKLLSKLLGDTVFLNALNEHSLSPFYVTQHLAYLPRQSKISGVQAFGFDNDYSKAEVKFPFEANWKQLSLTLDPGALLPIAPVFVSEDNNFLADYSPGDSVRLQVPSNWVDEPTYDLVMRALINSIDPTLASLSADLFTPITLSDEAKQMGASRAILIMLKPEDQVKLMVTLVRDTANNLKLGLSDSRLDDEKKLKFAAIADQALKMSDEIYAKYQSDADMKMAIEKQLGELEMTLLIDSRGRMTGAVVNQLSGLGQKDGVELAIKTQSTMDIKKFGSAKAPFAPKADQIIDGNQIVKGMIEKYKAKKAGLAGDNTSFSEELADPRSAATEAWVRSAVSSADKDSELQNTPKVDQQAASAAAPKPSLWMETNKILVESDPESKAEFCEIYDQYDAAAATQKSSALSTFSQNTLSSDAAGAAAAGAVFYRYLAKSYSDADLDCGVAPAP